MYYEINVALNGRHFFATAPRSLTDEKAARTMFELFRAKFPEAEGYSLTLSRLEAFGHTLATT